MKRILEIGVSKRGYLRLEAVDLTDLRETVNENTAVFDGHTMVTRRSRGRDFSDWFHVSRAYLKQHSQWCVVASQSASVAKPHASLAKHVRSEAA